MLVDKLETLRSSGLLSEYQRVEVSGDRYQGIPVYQSDRINSLRTWARVYFVDCDALLSHEGKLTVRSCTDFQSELLGRAFFEENTALRWNMYLYFVYEEACALERIDRVEIESDTHYARKYVVPTSTLPASFCLTNYSLLGKTMPEPEMDWQNILAPAGLIDCLYDNKYNNLINHYLSSASAAPKHGLSMHNTVQADDTLRIQRLDTLSVRRYREAVFGEKMTIPLKQVNIIEGANGSGKSSLIDVIEYAMTGSVKRFADNDGDPQRGFAEVTGINQAGGPLRLPSEGSPDIKSREQAWYHIPKTAKKTTIGIKFEQINRFSIESVFSLVYSQCRDKDQRLVDSITALCFDETLLLMEKNWITYLERFNNEKYSIEKDLAEIATNQNNCESRRQTLARQIQERQVNLNKLHLALFGTETQHEYSQFEDFKLLFDRDIAAVGQVKQSISFKCLSQDASQHDQSLLELRMTAEKHNKLEQQKIQIRQEYQYLQSQTSMLRDQNDHYSELLRQVQDCKAQFTDDISEDMLKQTLSKDFDTFGVIEKIRLENYDFLANNRNQLLLPLSEIEMQEQDKKSQISQLGKDLKECNDQKYSMMATMTSMRQNIDFLEQKQIDLAHLGEVLVNSLQSSNCPLCGHTYLDTNELLKCINEFAINKAPMQEQMSLLQMELDNVEENIRKLERVLHEAQDRAAFLQNVRRICEALAKIYPLGVFTLLGDIALQLDEMGKTLSLRMKGMSHLLQAYGQLVSEFEAIGLTKSSLSVYEKYCIEAKSKFTNELEKTQVQKELLESRLSQIDKTLLEMGNVSESLIRCEQQNHSLHTLLDAVVHMRDGGLVVTEDTDILQLQKLLSQLDGAIAVTQHNKEIQDLDRKLAEFKQKQAIKKQMADRCQVAVKVLGQLENLSQYSHAFLEDNLQEVSRIFKKIHLPPEFSDLRIYQNEIVIMRPGSEQSVRINEMSLGQKTSLALSVMFQMHIMGKNTPRILLLDEPIANLDDIHIMNLIDILRELTLNGAQLVITTSNKEVARYFARKFAFLANDVTYYKLERKIEHGKVGVTAIDEIDLTEKIFYHDN